MKHLLTKSLIRQTLHVLLNHMAQITVPATTKTLINQMNNTNRTQYLLTTFPQLFKQDNRMPFSTSMTIHPIPMCVYVWILTAGVNSTYLCLSFSISLFSSSFSFSMKLCSTGISSFIYCATWIHNRPTPEWLSMSDMFCLHANNSSPRLLYTVWTNKLDIWHPLTAVVV